jgi:hypothetical protein
MEEVIRMPIGQPHYNVIDKSGINLPKTQFIIIQAFNGGMRFIQYNSLVLHIVIILVNSHLTRIVLPPWHNASSVGVNRITLDAKIRCKDTNN